MFNTFTKIFSIFIVGILMNLSLTGCGSSNSSNTPTDPTPTPPIETVKLAAVEVSPATNFVEINGTVQYTATAIFDDGTTTDVTSSAVWNISDTAIAFIDEKGTATGLSVGSVTLAATYTSDDIEKIGAANLDVVESESDVTFESLSIDGVSQKTVGESAELIAIATLSDNTTYIVNDKVDWTSSDTTIATVAATGMVSTVTVGDVVITATGKIDNTIVATHDLKVVAAEVTLKSIQIERGYNEATPQPITTLDVPITTEVYITAWAIYSDGTRVYVNTDTVWWSDNQQVASINSRDSSNVYGRDIGTANIMARYEGKEATLAVTVVLADGAPTLTAITLKTTDGTDVTGGTIDPIPAGFKTWVTAYGTYSDGTTVDINRYVNYTSDNPEVAYVNDVIDSNIRGRSGDDSAVITAEWQGKSASVTAPVIGLTSIIIKTGEGATNPLPNIVIDINNPLTMETGRTNKVYITAHGIYTDGQERYINAEVFWKSDNYDVASMSLLQRDSWVTGETNGTTQVSATLGEFEGRATVIVELAD